MDNNDSTLDSTIHRILIAISDAKSIMHGREEAYHILRDFMAQKFGAAYLSANEETLVVLQDLFSRLTTREIK